MKINIHAVAKEAGVSPTTVSRVINNNYPVNEQTRKRVEQAIKKLNYSPNAIARGLVCNKTFTVGIITPSIRNLFFPTILETIEQSLGEKGYSIYLCTTESNDEKEIKFVNSFVSRQVDGIITIDPSETVIKSGFYEQVAQSKPLVCINGYHKDIALNFVLTDQTKGAIDAFEYLLELGHKKIAFVRGDRSYSYDLKEKIYVDQVVTSNVSTSMVIKIGDGNNPNQIDTMTQIITSSLMKYEPTAIFACNDLMALACLNACNNIGLLVPNDISIIGFDNIVLSTVANPKLTTVDMNMRILGQTASQLLLKIMRSPHRAHEKIILDSTLLKRESCCSPHAY